ncbi:unnamed protein product, partial [Brenthis ino]
MQARCQLQRRPTFLPSNFYFLRARQGGRSHHATNYESGAKCSTADIRTLAPPCLWKIKINNTTLVNWRVETSLRAGNRLYIIDVRTQAAGRLKRLIVLS